MKRIFIALGVSAAFVLTSSLASGQKNDLEQSDEDIKIAKCTEAIRLTADNAALYGQRGELYCFIGQYTKAIDDQTEAIRLDPKNAYYYSNRGNAYRRQGYYDKAIADHTEAIRLLPNDNYAYYWRAYDYEDKGEYDKAITDFIAGAKRDPKEDGDTYRIVAQLLASCPDPKVRDGKKAVEYALKACELSQWQNKFYLDALAAAYAEAGDFDEAVKWEKHFIEIGPPRAGYIAEGRERLKLYETHQPYHEDTRKFTTPAFQILSNVDGRLVLNDKGYLDLILSNGSDKAVTFRTDIAPFGKHRFLDFPNNGAFQLRSEDKSAVAMQLFGTNWFYPRELNNELDQPLLPYKDGHPPKPEWEEPSNAITLAGHIKTTIGYDCNRVLNISAYYRTGSPKEFRVKMDITILTDKVRSVVSVISDWMPLPHDP